MKIPPLNFELFMTILYVIVAILELTTDKGSFFLMVTFTIFAFLWGFLYWESIKHIYTKKP